MKTKIPLKALLCVLLALGCGKTPTDSNPGNGIQTGYRAYTGSFTGPGEAVHQIRLEKGSRPVLRLKTWGPDSIKTNFEIADSTGYVVYFKFASRDTIVDTLAVGRSRCEEYVLTVTARSTVVSGLSYGVWIHDSTQNDGNSGDDAADSRANATLVQVADSVEVFGFAGWLDRYDIYAFNVPQGRWISVAITNLSPTLDFSARIPINSANILDFYSLRGETTVVRDYLHADSVGGLHHLILDAGDMPHGPTGQYRLAWKAVRQQEGGTHADAGDDFTGATVLAGAGIYTGRVGNEDYSDYYKIPVAASEICSIRISLDSAQERCAAAIYDATRSQWAVMSYFERDRGGSYKFPIGSTGTFYYLRLYKSQGHYGRSTKYFIELLRM